jgi:hypothetical protein
MFERVAPSKEQIDAEAAEGRSPDQIAALRLAALVILANTCLTIVLVVAVPSLKIPIISIVISLILVYYLYRLRPRAEALALGLTILAGAAGLLSVLTSKFAPAAIVGLVPTAALACSLLLLLIGDPPRSRRIAALVVFGVLVGGFTALALVGQFAQADK